METARAEVGPRNVFTVRMLTSYAGAVAASGDFDRAIVLQNEASELLTQLYGECHSETLQAKHRLALYYSFGGRTDQAVRCGEEVLELMRKSCGDEDRSTLVLMNDLALISAVPATMGERLRC